MYNKIYLICLCLLLASQVKSQDVNWVSSKEGNYWKQNKAKLQKSVSSTPDLIIADKKGSTTFQGWGTCFNELGWDALNLLPQNEKDKILQQLFSPEDRKSVV